MQNSSVRLYYLDVLRGFAILLMVIDHVFDWWLDAPGHLGRLAGASHFLGTLAAPLFLFLVGVGLVLSAARSDNNGWPRRRTALRFFKRGSIIFLGGFLLNLAVFYTGTNPQDIWAADVLHAIGLSIICMIPLLWLPGPVVAGVCLGLIVVGQAAIRWALPPWLQPFIATGYFPLALWLPYTCLGVVFGKLFHQGRLQKKDIYSLLGFALLGFLLIPFVNPAWGYRHPRPVFVLFSILVIVLLILVTWAWTERFARRGPVAHALQDMGRASLMLYVFHHLIAYRLFLLFGWVTGRSWRGEYGIFTPLQAGVMFVVLILLMVFATRWWLSRLKLTIKHGLFGRQKQAKA